MRVRTMEGFTFRGAAMVTMALGAFLLLKPSCCLAATLDFPEPKSAWIRVFVLTLSECRAPVGKSMCVPQDPYTVTFLDPVECSVTLDSLMMDYFDDERAVLTEKPKCEARVIAVQVYDKQSDGEIGLGINPYDNYAPEYLWEEYQKRLRVGP